MTVNGHEVSFLIDSGNDVPCLGNEKTQRVSIWKELVQSRTFGVTEVRSCQFKDGIDKSRVDGAIEDMPVYGDETRN